jgi:hypothetical protein
VPQSRSERSDIAVILAFMGAALLLVYLVTVLIGAFPLAILLPEWQLRFTGSLRGGASFPIEGTALILIASRIDPASSSLIRWVKWLRQLAVIAALGFLLLIPMQLFASVTQLRLVRDQDQQLLTSLSSATKAIASSSTSAEFAAAVAQLPGAPPLRKEALTTDFRPARLQLLAQLDPQIRQLTTQVEASRSARINQMITVSLRDSLVTFFYAVAFAAVAKIPGRSYSLLSDLLMAVESVGELRPATVLGFFRDRIQGLLQPGRRRRRR